MHKNTVRHLVILVSCLVVVIGCDREPSVLQLADLTPDERLYIERVVTLERAKAVALSNRPVGTALLDSVAAAWGDSSEIPTTAGLSSEPVRSADVADLLLRILVAEQDSLIHAPRPDRLHAPLPDPLPPEPEPEPQDGTSES